MLHAPEWLLLLPALAFVGWRWPMLGLHRPRRAAALLVTVLLLADPRLPSRRGGMDLWVLLDRSASTAGLVDEGAAEWLGILEANRPGRHDQLHTVDFAADVVADESEGKAIPPSRRNLTRSALALRHVLAAQSGTRPARVLVITDGYSTEPLREVGQQLLATGIPLDYRLAQAPADGDTRLARVSLPTRTRTGEAFVLGINVSGPPGKKVPMTLFRDDQEIGNDEVTLGDDGRATTEWIDRLDAEGAHRYEVVLAPPEDPRLANNRGEAWIEVTGGPRVLLITRHPDDPLAEAFASQGLDVDLVTEPEAATPGRLAGARAAVIHNVPAFDLDDAFLEALDFFVREQAGGLLMVGGRHAFGSGGYFRSPLDPLLPVSMELKTEHRKLAVAMAIVLDRSGSMSAAVAGGAGGNATKMDLANSGAIATLDLLGSSDLISVFAVDSSPHTIVPLTPVGGNKGRLRAAISRIKSMGGGIYVYNGLSAGWKELRKATVGTRHIILFSDAADSEEPGNYRALLRKITGKGGSVSVIGLGNKGDTDANLLRNIARLGKGRIQFTENAAEIPRLFASETVTVARSAFLDEPVACRPTGAWEEISPAPIDWIEEIDAYNLSYAREGASVALLSGDDYAAPLVATIRRGLGRSAAVSFPLAGEHSARVRSWPGYGGFVKTLSRWLAGDEMPPGIGLQHRLEGTRLTVDLHYLPESWATEIAGHPPRLRLAVGSDKPVVREHPWQRLAPGHFAASVDVGENALVRGVVQVGGHALPFGPVVAGLSTEWTFDPDRLRELRLLSARTGGVDRADLATAWTRPPVWQRVDLHLPLATLLLLLILGDAFLTKTGIQLRWPKLKAGAAMAAIKMVQTGTAKVKRRPRGRGKPEEPAPRAHDTPQPPPPAQTQPDAEQRRSRYQRAKSKK